MGTVLELSGPELPVRAPVPAAAERKRSKPAAAAAENTWLTATIRPAGTIGRNDTGRLRALLDALSACASIVVLDLQVARLRSPGAGEVIEDAAWDLEVAVAASCVSTSTLSPATVCRRPAATLCYWMTRPRCSPSDDRGPRARDVSNPDRPARCPNQPDKMASLTQG